MKSQKTWSWSGLFLVSHCNLRKGQLFWTTVSSLQKIGRILPARLTVCSHICYFRSDGLKAQEMPCPGRMLRRTWARVGWDPTILWFGNIVQLVQEAWGERVRIRRTFICTQFSPFLPSFSHPFNVTLVGDRKGFCVRGTWAGWEQQEPVLRCLAKLGQAGKTAWQLCLGVSFHS
jgi:hypothetical protein